MEAGKKISRERSGKKERRCSLKKNQLLLLNKKPATNTFQNKELQKELQKAQKLFQQLEEKMTVLNKEKSILESDLALPEIYLDKQKFIDAENRYYQKSNN